MQARRILLLFGFVLLLTAAAASFVPVPEEEQGAGGETTPTETGDSAASDPTAPDDPERDDAVEVGFQARGKPRERTVEAATRVVVTVETGGPGQVELEGLGLIQDVGPGTPAVFDLFTDRTGRFDVTYTPTEGEQERLGTLVVEAAGDGSQPGAAVDGEGRRSAAGAPGPT